MIARFLGAVGKYFLWRDQTGWHESFWVAWWPVTSVDLAGPQMAHIGRMRFCSGLRDWTRGRHWDRRSRYGIK